jgi:hypothetical protein
MGGLGLGNASNSDGCNGGKTFKLDDKLNV